MHYLYHPKSDVMRFQTAFTEQAVRAWKALGYVEVDRTKWDKLKQWHERK